VQFFEEFLMGSWATLAFDSFHNKLESWEGSKCFDGIRGTRVPGDANSLSSAQLHDKIKKDHKYTWHEDVNWIKLAQDTIQYCTHSKDALGSIKGMEFLD
jgi:hypothetical protein